MNQTLSKKSSSPPVIEGAPFRVMVVDDSAVIRGFLTRWLDEDDEITVVSTAANGLMALRSVRSSNAEVVILDIEMPQMDGMTALPKLIELVPDIKVIMASALTLRNADISMKALAGGAADYIPKPESARDVNASTDFRRDLLSKVKALAASRRKDRREKLPSRDRSYGGAVRPVGTSSTSGKSSLFGDKAKVKKEIVLVKQSSVKPTLLAIGSSTGGPQALCKVLSDAKHFLDVPVVITQHMPATFTAILAEHIGRATGKPTKEAEDGDELKVGHIYVAPGGKHMTIKSKNGRRFTALNDGPPINFCKPAVDPMFESVAEIYGPSALSLILTGMGSDGAKGARKIVDAGGTVVAQDEATSIVWGMPGAAVNAGVCAGVYPLDDIGATLGRKLMGGQL